MFVPTLILLITPLSLTLGQQKFTYALSDVLYIPYPQIVDISNSLTTSSTEYIDQGEIIINQSFNQTRFGIAPLVQYNIIYFNLQNFEGRKCYFDFFNSSSLPSNITQCQNTTIDQSIDDGVSCVNFTGCTSQNFIYDIDLAQIQYKQNIILIQNSHSSNAEAKLSMYLVTSTNIEIYNSNVWFYVSVALTCLLLLSLVLLTGVVLYWTLKYRKAKRALEELKLTEADSEGSTLRKSLRNSLMKNQ